MRAYLAPSREESALQRQQGADTAVYKTGFLLFFLLCLLFLLFPLFFFSF